MRRLTPFELVFEPLAQTTFPPIRSALDQASQDPRDRDRFLMLREVVTLLRDLRPEGGLGEGIDQLAALVHHAYLFWAAGSQVMPVSSDRLDALLAKEPEVSSDHRDLEPFYLQLPEHRVWAEVIPDHPPEPLDGFFAYLDSDERTLRALGVFGIHSERPGFSVVEVMGERPQALARLDNSRLFAPTLAGGVAAHLFSLSGAEELLELGWRAYVLGVGSRESGANRSTASSLAPSS
jgi:hypothetical protein